MLILFKNRVICTFEPIEYNILQSSAPADHCPNSRHIHLIAPTNIDPFQIYSSLSNQKHRIILKHNSLSQIQLPQTRRSYSLHNMDHL